MGACTYFVGQDNEFQAVLYSPQDPVTQEEDCRNASGVAGQTRWDSPYVPPS